LGDIFCHCDTQYDTELTAVSIIHMIRILTSAVRLLSADDSCASGERGGKVQAIQYIIIFIEFWDFTWYSVVYILLQNQYIAMLHSSIWYWYR